MVFIVQKIIVQLFYSTIHNFPLLLNGFSKIYRYSYIYEAKRIGA